MTSTTANSKRPVRPAFGTLEWAPHSVNFTIGCSHNCLYCYSKEMAIRFGRKTTTNWHIEEVNVGKLQHKRRYNGRVMFPTSHDITPSNLDSAMILIRSLLEAGNELLIVSKPHEHCIKKICSQLVAYRRSILFRFTIGSPKDSVLKFWEPNAPSFNERMQCLRIASESDFPTSISIEPMLDSVENIASLINTLLPYVSDSIWVGKPNFLFRRLKMNGVLTKEVAKKARELEEIVRDETIRMFYKKFHQNCKIKWKDSIKEVVGIERPIAAGRDI